MNGAENPGFNSQIPGALEGTAPRPCPFYLLPIPETPFILAALLSTLGCALLAWYIQKRLPKLSPNYLFLWIAITPWGLFEGAHVSQPRFPSSFLAFYFSSASWNPCLPAFSQSLLAPFWSNALMGFSLLWIMQFHFSYIYFIPLAAYSLFVQIRNSKKPASLIYFAAGCLPMLALLIPTFIKYGLIRTNVASGFTIPFNWDNVAPGPRSCWPRFLSLVCFELPRFPGGPHLHPDRAFLTSHPSLTLPGAILLDSRNAPASYPVHLLV